MGTENVLFLLRSEALRNLMEVTRDEQSCSGTGFMASERQRTWANSKKIGKCYNETASVV
jgi:hypothetical protein